jgi:hypothetical protein
MSTKLIQQMTLILFRTFVVFVFAASLVIALPGATMAYTLDPAEEVTDFTVYLPMAINDFPYVPPPAEVYVENNTGSQLCYTVDDTGIGEKCFPPGTHYYGTFPPGTYTWYASASCGSGSGTEFYESGIFTHTFWCE